MTNLPEQAHGTAVATTSLPEQAYQIDGSMVKLPSLYLAQYSSKAFKASTVKFGDIYVGVGAEDPEPQVVGASTGSGLSEPVRFYVHAVAPGYQVVDKSAAYGKRSLRPGTSYQDAIREAGGKPQDVFLQTFLTVTVPDYPLYPVRFIMGSKWGGSSARWLNTKISMAIQEKRNPLDLAFQIQTRATSNERGDFVEAVVGFAKLDAKDEEADQQIVENHAMLLASGAVDTSYEDVQDATVASEAPSLA